MSRCISANGTLRSDFFIDFRRAFTGAVDGTLAGTDVVGAFMVATVESRVIRDARGVGDKVSAVRRL